MDYLPPELVWESQTPAIKIAEHQARKQAIARGLPGTVEPSATSQA